MSLGKSDPPPAPDYTGAAVATAQGNKEAAIASQRGSMVNQVTPYGNLNYDQTGTDSFGNPIYTASTTLTPQGQQLFDINQGINLGLGNLASSGLGFVQNTLNQPFDWSKVAAAPVNAGTTGQAAIMSRLQPQIDRENQAFESQMANQGIAPGSEAYMNAKRSLDQSHNDLLQQAALQGISLDTSARQQGIQEQEFARTEPLNILNAVRSSAPVNLPSFVNTPGQQYVGGPNYLGAAQATGQYNTDVYNAQAAQQGNFLNAAATLGGAAMMGGFNPFSLGGAGATTGLSLGGSPLASNYAGGGLRLAQF